jgi:hypothetical protein
LVILGSECDLVLHYILFVHLSNSLRDRLDKDRLFNLEEKKEKKKSKNRKNQEKIRKNRQKLLRQCLGQSTQHGSHELWRRSFLVLLNPRRLGVSRHPLDRFLVEHELAVGQPLRLDELSASAVLGSVGKFALKGADFGADLTTSP